MTDIERQIKELSVQLHELQRRQMQMNAEINSAAQKLQELTALSAATEDGQVGSNEVLRQPAKRQIEPLPILAAKAKMDEKKAIQQKTPSAKNHELEDFIGTNLISKVGILVTIIGVFIGAKYAIDNELISPFMRILAGYAAAGILIAISLRLKKKYEYFSSILIGGGLSVTYFISYIAYSFYAMFPSAIAFVIMVITTVAAVVIALWYNQKIIAFLGQVAAYAIPFLLGNGHGNIFILFSYVTVINFGLLILSFKKDWKLLYHIAFFLTWFIYFLSVVVIEKVAGNFTGGLFFLSITFLTFYGTFLAYKVYKKELYELGEIGILLLNALFFFFLGTYLVNHNFSNIHFLTTFTIANACIHLAVGFTIYKLNLVDESVFKFILGLGLLFITIAIPIEFNGSWVTTLWTVEATALAYVARNSKRILYLQIALPLVIISFLSLLQDWYLHYPFINGAMSHADVIKTPFANVNFILPLLVCCCIGAIIVWSKDIFAVPRSLLTDFFVRFLPLAFVGILYCTFFNEIHFAWDKTIYLHPYQTSVLFRGLCLITFSCIYMAAWFIANIRLIKRQSFHQLLTVLAFVVNLIFITEGLYLIGELRHYYIIYPGNATIFLLACRYIAFAALAIIWISAWHACKIFNTQPYLQNLVSYLFNFTLLFIISNEFIHWMDLAGYQNQYKLGLSLIGGGYALSLLFAGIIKNKRHLRIAAIVLFTATLLKLFFYDLASLSTISKTIVLVLLGILLLFASFLYNKYKDLLFEKNDGTK